MWVTGVQTCALPIYLFPIVGIIEVQEQSYLQSNRGLNVVAEADACWTPCAGGVNIQSFVGCFAHEPGSQRRPAPGENRPARLRVLRLDSNASGKDITCLTHSSENNQAHLMQTACRSLGHQILYAYATPAGVHRLKPPACGLTRQIDIPIRIKV